MDTAFDDDEQQQEEGPPSSSSSSVVLSPMKRRFFSCVPRLSPRVVEMLSDALLIGGYYTCSSIFLVAVEKWTWTDAVYFLTVSVTTVGYGDLAPTTTLGRLGACVMIAMGIVSIFTKLSKYATYLQDLINSHQTSFFARLGLALVDCESLPIEVYSPHEVNRMVFYPRRYFVKLAPTLLLVILMFVYGCLDMDLTVVDSFYFTVVSVSTVGYGDVAPRSNRNKLFFCTVSLILVVAVANTISEVLCVRTRRKVREGRFALPNLEELMLAKIRAFPDQDEPQLTESDYIVDALLKGNLVDREVLTAIRRIYYWTAKSGDDDHSDISVEDLFHFLRQRTDDDEADATGGRTSATRTQRVSPSPEGARDGRSNDQPCTNESPKEQAATYEQWLETYWRPRARQARVQGAHRRLSTSASISVTQKNQAIIAAMGSPRRHDKLKASSNSPPPHPASSSEEFAAVQH